MHRLEAVIEQFGRWSELRALTDRINAHLATDFSLCIENANSLLDTISKEICKEHGVDLGKNPKLKNTIKKAYGCMGHSGDSEITQISTSLSSIGQRLSELRNKDGLTAHGKTLEELRQRNEAYTELTREFLIDTVVTTAVFLIRSFEAESPLVIRVVEGVNEQEGTTLNYLEHEGFNAIWDENFGDFIMADYSYPASEVLFNVDIEAYSTELRAHQESPE